MKLMIHFFKYISIFLSVLIMFSCEKKGNSIFEEGESEDYIPLESIKILPESIEGSPGGDYAAVVTFYPNTATNKEIYLETSDSNVAVVEEVYGKPGQLIVYFIAPGSCELTAITEDGRLMTNCSITVLPSPIEKILFEKETYMIGNFEVYKLEYSLVPEYAMTEKLIWESSDKKVVTVDNEGVIHGQNFGGEATITVHTLDQRVSASCRIKVLENTDIANLYTTFNLDISENDDDVITGDLSVEIMNKTPEPIYLNYVLIKSQDKIVKEINLYDQKLPVGLSFTFAEFLNKVYKPRCVVSFSYRNQEYITEKYFNN